MSSPGFSSPVELPCLGSRAVAAVAAVAAAAAALALAAMQVPWLPSVLAPGVALVLALAALTRRPASRRLRLSGAGCWLVAGGAAPLAVRCTHGWVLAGRVAGLALAAADGRVSAVYLVRSACPPDGWRRLRAWLACR